MRSLSKPWSQQDSSSGGLLFQEGLTDTELDSQLDSLRTKLATVSTSQSGLHLL